MDMFKVRDLVVKDPVALKKWPLIMDRILYADADPDKLRIKRLIIERGEYEEAILESLKLWNSYGAKREDLDKVLRDHDLNALADKIQEKAALLGISNGSQMCQSPTPKLAVWFEVGEVVYNFTGRETQLARLHQMLMTSHSTKSVAANIVSIYGLGGIGKSSLAREYAHRHRSEYDENMIWINAETVHSMKASFVRLATRLDIPTSEKDSNQDVSSRVYEKFQDKKSLLIFDNVEEYTHFQQFQPQLANPNNQTPHILITTRRNDVAPLTENQINLDVLDLKEAVDLIRRQLPHAMDACATKLAEALQRLPLALQQALAYIRDKYTNDRDCISKYLKEFETSEQSLLNDKRFQENNEYARTTFATWSITLDRIQGMAGGGMATKTIQSLAYLNPDLISVQFVESIFKDKAGTQLGLKLLERFSMLSVHNGKIRIHRLVQKVVGISLTSEQEIQIMNQVIEVIRVQFVKYEITDYTRECMSHALHLFPFQVKDNELMKGRSKYVADLCYFLERYGSYSTGLIVAERSVEVYESMHGVGPEHEDTIKMKWKAADSHDLLKNHSKSMELLESILPISKSKLGQEHWLTMNILSSMAGTHHSAKGNYKEAIKIYDEIIPVRVRLHGENSNVLSARQNKAIVLRKLGKLKEALELLHYVYEKRVKLHGKDDLRTLGVGEDIGYVFEDKRDFRMAIEILTEVYEGYMQVFGETHPNTIRVKKNIEITKANLLRQSKCLLQ